MRFKEALEFLHDDGFKTIKLPGESVGFPHEAPLEIIEVLTEADSIHFEDVSPTLRRLTNDDGIILAVASK